MWLRVVFLSLLLALGLQGGEAHLRVAFYNVENFHLTPAEGVRVKSPESVAAVVEVIRSVNADVLALCEMGSLRDAGELRGLLEDVGLHYEHFEYHQSLDEARRLCVLSRIPIVRRDSQAELFFELDGRREPMRRGILDVTLQMRPEEELRLVAVHLKSRRPVPQGEALIRRNEAMLLRRHIDAIFQHDPDVALILAGDLNDTKDQPAILEVQGVRGREGYLQDVRPSDDVGDVWTHFWRETDVYSRIDYLMVSKALRKRIAGSGIPRAPQWSSASDHRLLFVDIKR